MGIHGRDLNVPVSARVAETLRAIGELLRLEAGSRYRAEAYERGARVLEAVPDLESFLRTGTLTELPGIGPSLARTVDEVVRTGRSGLLERLRRKYPPGAAELSTVLSLPRIRSLHEALGVTTLVSLRAACKAGCVRLVRGFGEKSERNLLARIDALASRRREVTLSEAAGQGDELREHFLRHPSVQRVELAGALRRRIETIDGLELVVASEDAEAVEAHALRARGSVSSSSRGTGRFGVLRPGGLDADVRVVPPPDFAAAWLHATGSSAHIDGLARIAANRGLSLDDHGLREGPVRLSVPDEGTIYERLGLDFVPAEMREGVGEVEAAAEGRLPADLVHLDDIQGAVHCHTVDSDGKQTIEEMACAAEALGLRYLTITDHSASATYAHGLDLDRLRRQSDEIARVRERTSIRLLHGTESDILRDGSLDYPDAVLGSLDVVIASIHNRYKMDADEMTRRVIRAIRHPLFKIWGHALGRYVLSRPPFECRMEEVLDAVAGSRAAIEVNGDPHRLDLEPRWIREARKRGIRFVVSADAHSTGGLRNLRWGVDMARRGWLRRSDVLNTLGPNEFAAAVRP